MQRTLERNLYGAVLLLEWAAPTPPLIDYRDLSKTAVERGGWGRVELIYEIRVFLPQGFFLL